MGSILLAREDSQEEEMATHSSILARKTPWTEEPGSLLCPWDHKELYTTENIHTHIYVCVYWPLYV